MGGKVGGRSTTPFHQGGAANNLMNNPSPKTSGGKHERKKKPSHLPYELTQDRTQELIGWPMAEGAWIDHKWSQKRNQQPKGRIVASCSGCG